MTMSFSGGGELVDDGRSFAKSLGSIARRGMATCAEDHMNLRVLTAGNAESQTVPTQMLKSKEHDPNIRYGYTLPHRGDVQVISALLPADKFEYTSDYNSTQLAIAATTTAADLVMKAGFDPPVAYQNLDIFATSASKRGMDFRDPQLTALIPWIAEVAARS